MKISLEKIWKRDKNHLRNNKIKTWFENFQNPYCWKNKTDDFFWIGAYLFLNKGSFVWKNVSNFCLRNQNFT